MVRIEKIEMQGFKSFAKKTLVTFPSNFSIICGPNGNGKSNVLDAVCFVLGRKSAKSLRADGMKEMIFNGGLEKSAAEFAKVKLYFDNRDKVFPIEEEEMSISRQVNRKGVSIYKLNGSTVTRESILEILRVAHIHPDGHNIIQQGDIMEMIEMSPKERREVIDEISGIREFDQKREKALKELETVEKRLEGNAIALGEKETNLKRLEFERRSAKEHQTLSKELDKLRSSLAKIRLEEAEDAMEKLNEKLNSADIKQLDEELNEIDNELKILDAEKNSLSIKAFDRKDVELIKKVEHLKSEINMKFNKIERNKFEIKQIEEMVKKFEMAQTDSGNRVVDSIMKLGRTGVYGTVANLITVPKEYQTAIEVAAGNHLYDIITHDKDLAIECLKYLKTNKIGRATFLPLDKIHPRDIRSAKDLLNENSVVGLAIELIDFNQKYFNAISFVVGDTVIVKTIDDAKRIGIGKARFVTLDGDLVEKSGAIIGGFYSGKRGILLGSESKEYEKTVKNLKLEIVEFENEIGKLNKELNSVQTEETTEEKEFANSRKQTVEIDEKLSILRNKRRAVYERKTTAEFDINRLNISRAKLEAGLENIKAEFENYKNKETYDMKPEILQTNINEALRKISSLGPVNQRALEDYDQQKLIFDDLKQKVEKLAEERNKVFSMITEIEGRRMECFMKTFSEVAKHFKEVFYDLTKGIGEIVLENPENIESGLLIRASPGGKKLINIDLMSGGEKTLTALAFLFAQQFNPAPFYILDEIDAALDKPNSKKVTDLLKKYSDKTEFIVITHNDTTIQAADVVYGVTMDKGESTVIAIKMPN